MGIISGFPKPIFRQLSGFLMSGGQGRDKAGKHLEHQGGDTMLLIQWLMVNGYWFMVICGYLWLFMVIYGYLWLFMVSYG